MYWDYKHRFSSTSESCIGYHQLYKMVSTLCVRCTKLNKVKKKEQYTNAPLHQLQMFIWHRHQNSFIIQITSVSTANHSSPSHTHTHKLIYHFYPSWREIPAGATLSNWGENNGFQTVFVFFNTCRQNVLRLKQFIRTKEYLKHLNFDSLL